VVNRYSYCYKILAHGEYSDPGILKPLLNNSQESCAYAGDVVPPCAPSLSIDANCITGFVKVSWPDVRQRSCGDDVLKYVLFYKSTVDAPYAIVDTLDNTTFSYTYDGLSLISGCYAIQAVDSSGNASVMSPDFCLDNCPLFELPNIFSPNGDGANDFYKAIKVRQIKEINLNIYDRWGNLVYTTRDPYFKWDGISLQSKIMVSDGTFFYFCEVFEPRLTGIKTRKLQGFVQVVK
jgi:gliding motility-associated-like protein